MADVEFTLQSNKDLIMQATEEAIHTALEAVGVQAQAHATAQITANGSVDTGRLRASITYAVSGDSGKLHQFTDDQGESYSESLPSVGEQKDHTVYIGTNVFYGMYIELGTSRMSAKPFLRPAVNDNLSEYQQIFEQVLSKIGN